MSSTADDGSRPSVRARLLRQLTSRLEAASELSADVRRGLAAGDAASIDRATARLETVAEEFKVLAAEYGRVADAGDERDADGTGELAAVEAAAARLARSSALSGGLLERMVAMSRGLLDLVALAKDGTYDSSGRAPELAASGVRLQERA